MTERTAKHGSQFPTALARRRHPARIAYGPGRSLALNERQRCSNHSMASLENFRVVVFRAVAEQLSFRKAAEELYLTQPAVSLQIKALEEDLGVQLFDRGGAHITLTDAGRVLLDYARQVNSLLLEAEHGIAALSGEHAGQLALGASTTIAQYVLPRLLGEFCKEHPRVHPTLISGANASNSPATSHRHGLTLFSAPSPHGT